MYNGMPYISLCQSHALFLFDMSFPALSLCFVFKNKLLDTKRNMTGNKDHSISITGCHISQSRQHELMQESTVALGLIFFFSAWSFLKMASINMILKGKVLAYSNGTVAEMYIREYPYHTCTLFCFRQQLVGIFCV